MEQARAGEYDEFVVARWSGLFHLARLLTGGDRHRAEDLLQDSLVRLWFVWPKIADEAPEAYVRKVMARAAARSARRRWWGERPVEELPEVASAGDMSAIVAERSRLEAALALLTPRQRAAVVLRYYQDLPDRQVAEVLGCPVGTARSHAARGVARLRHREARSVAGPRHAADGAATTAVRRPRGHDGSRASAPVRGPAAGRHRASDQRAVPAGLPAPHPAGPRPAPAARQGHSAGAANPGRPAHRHRRFASRPAARGPGAGLRAELAVLAAHLSLVVSLLLARSVFGGRRRTRSRAS